MTPYFVGNAEDQRKLAAWEKLKQLDHDEDGKPGGSKPRKKAKANG